MVMVEGGKDVSWRRLVVLWGGRSTTLPIELELEFNSMGKALVWRRSWLPVEPLRHQPSLVLWE